MNMYWLECKQCPIDTDEEKKKKQPFPPAPARAIGNLALRVWRGRNRFLALSGRWRGGNERATGRRLTAQSVAAAHLWVEARRPCYSASCS